ncbi:MAG: hypothetical protein ACLVB3_09450 [Clostridium sp.]
MNLSGEIGLDLISMIAPNDPNCNGSKRARFIYVVSSLGVTGVNEIQGEYQGFSRADPCD